MVNTDSYCDVTLLHFVVAKSTKPKAPRVRVLMPQWRCQSYILNCCEKFNPKIDSCISIALEIAALFSLLQLPIASVLVKS